MFLPEKCWICQEKLNINDDFLSAYCIQCCASGNRFVISIDFESKTKQYKLRNLDIVNYRGNKCFDLYTSSLSSTILFKVFEGKSVLWSCKFDKGFAINENMVKKLILEEKFNIFY